MADPNAHPMADPFADPQAVLARNQEIARLGDAVHLLEAELLVLDGPLQRVGTFDDDRVWSGARADQARELLAGISATVTAPGRNSVRELLRSSIDHLTTRRRLLILEATRRPT